MSAGLFVSLMLRHYLHPSLKYDIGLSLPDLIISLTRLFFCLRQFIGPKFVASLELYFSSVMHVFVLIFKARSELTVILTENTRICQIHMEHTDTHVKPP